MHQLMERPNASFMASYLGGDPQDYDALNAGTAIDGDTTAWRKLLSEEVIDDYQQVQQYLDVVNYADYMLLQFYAGNDWDWNHSTELGRCPQTRRRRRLHLLFVGQ